ncbi:Lrp/AsnC family transcriptional regulator [Pseudanabaena sp. FACHB-2040]|uniref:Lrp/AsnC family transcriptional regulator n=1 Tax=Pseudanabaena sp. FACHB-2040 TaxID=2692859 RepID=UPI00168730AD|nr:Lrp/AsnC family transcriptional regulator [Pseudanabaena sp. FACHB-2040]MBD2260023.1 Lrp/AsnC family transcriptional regulator [Pseudanabaena sp. FACHB-2040]
MELDKIDLTILSCLTASGRMTWAELANQLGISSPAAADRVRKLEDAGVIEGYTALLNAASLGYDLTAFIAVTLERPGQRSTFLEHIDQLTVVQECHHMAGEDDYLLKVRCRHTRDLEHLISDVIKEIPGVVKTRTSIVLSTLKETPVLPMGETLGRDR